MANEAKAKGNERPSRPSKLFRKASLERLNSPERLDELMQVVGPKSWIALGGLGLLVILGVVWSVFGRVPVSVEGRGVLIHPRQVVELQSPLSGAVLQLNLRPGQEIKQGEVLVALDRSLLRHQLEQKKQELARLRKRRTLTGSLHRKRVELELAALKKQRAVLKQQISESRAQADTLLKTSKQALADRRAGLEKQLALFRGMHRRLQARSKRYQALEKKGVVSKTEILALEQSLMSSLVSIQGLESSIRDLVVREIEIKSQDLQRRHRILEMQSRLRDLDTQESQKAEETSEYRIGKAQAIETLERQIAALEKQLREESTIRSPYTGRVLEVTCATGQVISAGGRLGSLEIEDPQGTLVSVTCFPIKDGKRLKAAMALQVSPENVERERFGFLKGTVTSVGSFPVTSQEVSKIVGNPEVAKALAPPEGCILVFGSLERGETPSGYAWSSSGGPPLRLTTGTTTRTRVVVELRAPLSFVLPILRSAAEP